MTARGLLTEEKAGEIAFICPQLPENACNLAEKRL